MDGDFVWMAFLRGWRFLRGRRFYIDVDSL